ncbi:MAG: SAM-dependent chlorinase/fluorinase [Candidatus Bathyarchaeota archaeon]|nr:SAM-dependent chlorinase/fluorinase [Candidatus Termiticorpusculum sp.]
MITLTTDFGLTDFYAVHMDCVILSITPLTIINIAHEINKFNI